MPQTYSKQHHIPAFQRKPKFVILNFKFDSTHLEIGSCLPYLTPLLRAIFHCIDKTSLSHHLQCDPQLCSAIWTTQHKRRIFWTFFRAMQMLLDNVSTSLSGCLTFPPHRSEQCYNHSPSSMGLWAFWNKNALNYLPFLFYDDQKPSLLVIFPWPTINCDSFQLISAPSLSASGPMELLQGSKQPFNFIFPESNRDPATPPIFAHSYLICLLPFTNNIERFILDDCVPKGGYMAVQISSSGLCRPK